MDAMPESEPAPPVAAAEPTPAAPFVSDNGTAATAPEPAAASSETPVESAPQSAPMAAEAVAAAEPAASSAASDTPSAPTDEAASTPPRLPWIPEDIRPFSTAGLGEAVARRGTGELRTPVPAQQPAARPGTGSLTATRGTSTVVLVHGVPRATTALSLKRYLESLPHVSSVEPREYAEGILRLHVVGERNIQIDELRGWADGRDLQPVHVREDLVEVRLPH
jgi:hypothetical protein